MKGSSFVLAMVAVLSVPVVSMADLSEGTWALTISNEFADGPVYGTVNIKADTATGVVNFLVTPTTDVYDAIGANFGIQKFGFNFAGTSTFTHNLASIGWTMATNSSLDGFGKFELAPTGTGGSRQDPLEFMLTLTDKTQAIASNFGTQFSSKGYLFAAHIADFALGGVSGLSHFVADGTPVPAPGAMLLCVLGLGTLSAVRRRFT